MARAATGGELAGGRCLVRAGDVVDPDLVRAEVNGVKPASSRGDGGLVGVGGFLAIRVCALPLILDEVSGGREGVFLQAVDAESGIEVGGDKDLAGVLIEGDVTGGGAVGGLG